MSETRLSESGVRRAAKRIGWRLEKSRARNLHTNNCGLYQLIDDRNTVREGSRYDSTLEQCAEVIGQQG